MEYAVCEKCDYSLLHPSFLLCPICGHRREPEPFVITFGISVNAVSKEEAEKRARELLAIVKEKAGEDADGWIEGVDSLSESDKMAHYTNAKLNPEGEE